VFVFVVDDFGTDSRLMDEQVATLKRVNEEQIASLQTALLHGPSA
jgi:hypothetical protein